MTKAEVNLILKLTALVVLWIVSNRLIVDMRWGALDWQWWLVCWANGSPLVAIAKEYAPRRPA